MTTGSVYRMAIAYTVLMSVVVELVDVSAWAIVIAVAHVWFWMGRLSVSPNAFPDEPPPQEPVKWGRQ